MSHLAVHLLVSVFVTLFAFRAEIPKNSTFAAQF